MNELKEETKDDGKQAVLNINEWKKNYSVDQQTQEKELERLLLAKKKHSEHSFSKNKFELPQPKLNVNMMDMIMKGLPARKKERVVKTIEVPQEEEILVPDELGVLQLSNKHISKLNSVNQDILKKLLQVKLNRENEAGHTESKVEKEEMIRETTHAYLNNFDCMRKAIPVTQTDDFIHEQSTQLVYELGLQNRKKQLIKEWEEGSARVPADVVEEESNPLREIKDQIAKLPDLIELYKAAHEEMERSKEELVPLENQKAVLLKGLYKLRDEIMSLMRLSKEGDGKVKRSQTDEGEEDGSPLQLMHFISRARTQMLTSNLLDEKVSPGKEGREINHTAIQTARMKNQTELLEQTVSRIKQQQAVVDKLRGRKAHIKGFVMSVLNKLLQYPIHALKKYNYSIKGIYLVGRELEEDIKPSIIGGEFTEEEKEMLIGMAQIEYKWIQGKKLMQGNKKNEVPTKDTHQKKESMKSMMYEFYPEPEAIVSMVCKQGIGETTKSLSHRKTQVTQFRLTCRERHAVDESNSSWAICHPEEYLSQEKEIINVFLHKARERICLETAQRQSKEIRLIEERLEAFVGERVLKPIITKVGNKERLLQYSVRLWKDKHRLNIS